MSLENACNAGPVDSAKTLSNAVRTFVDTSIIPNESLLAAGGAPARKCLAELTAQAREAGLWGVFYPPSLGGKITSLEAYASIAEQEGRSEYGPAIFGSNGTLDVHMLHRHGSKEIHDQFLTPLVSGAAIAAYGMSEPDSIGSIPATIKTSARLSNGNWTLNGRKWFISRADRAAFVTVVAQTKGCVPGDATAASSSDHALSMIVVPTNTPGFKIERHLDVMGSDQGQCEISFNDVHVPQCNLLGLRDRGLDLMQQRLALGRTLRAMNWIGLAQRCFDLMCRRICSERGELARLSEKQLVRQRVFNVHQSIVSARALVCLAAKRVDAQSTSDIEVNMAKAAASQALSMASDSAIQIFGAEGIGSLTPLSSIYRTARTTHILDGTDEALISAVGRRILDVYKENRLEVRQ